MIGTELVYQNSEEYFSKSAFFVNTYNYEISEFDLEDVTALKTLFEYSITEIGIKQKWSLHFWCPYIRKYVCHLFHPLCYYILSLKKPLTFASLTSCFLPCLKLHHTFGSSLQQNPVSTVFTADGISPRQGQLARALGTDIFQSGCSSLGGTRSGNIKITRDLETFTRHLKMCLKLCGALFATDLL